MGFAANDDTDLAIYKHTEGFVWTMTLPSDGSMAKGASDLLFQFTVAISLVSASLL